MKIIECLVEIADCKSNDDVESARQNVIEKVTESCGSIDANKVKTFWDGDECGDAYVSFMIDEEDYAKAYMAFKEMGGCWIC